MSVPRCEVCAGVEICLRCSCSRQACVLESIFKQSMKITVTRSVWWESVKIFEDTARVLCARPPRARLARARVRAAPTDACIM